MAQQTITLSNEQAAQFAAAILPNAIRAFIDANRAEYEEWLAERKRNTERQRTTESVEVEQN